MTEASEPYPVSPVSTNEGTSAGTSADASEPLAPFLTVGQLRAEMEGLPDDAQVVITSSLRHTYDQGITHTLQQPLILWDHDCDDAEDGHRPGRDCPTVKALELWVDGYDEALIAQASARLQPAIVPPDADPAIRASSRST